MTDFLGRVQLAAMPLGILKRMKQSFSRDPRFTLTTHEPDLPWQIQWSVRYHYTDTEGRADMGLGIYTTLYKGIAVAHTM